MCSRSAANKTCGMGYVLCVCECELYVCASNACGMGCVLYVCVCTCVLYVCASNACGMGCLLLDKLTAMQAVSPVHVYCMHMCAVHYTCVSPVHVYCMCATA
jgi:hypothetical protein